jgi:hypothetical protein
MRQFKAIAIKAINQYTFSSAFISRFADCGIWFYVPVAYFLFCVHTENIGGFYTTDPHNYSQHNQCCDHHHRLPTLSKILKLMI